MRSRRLAAAGSLALGLAIVLSLVLVASGPAGDTESLSRASFGLEQTRSFDEFTLYSAGPHVDGLPLTAVLRRDDTASFVSFVYGDCVAEDDAGCAPPAEIQVWPACRRSLAAYDATLGASLSPVPERVVTRGLRGGLFDGGTRLELETGRSTVVVFASSRARVLRIAAALRAVDGSVRAGTQLPARVAEARGGARGC